MKAVIVSHGLIQDFEFSAAIMRGCDLIICADGGGEYVLKCGLVPDVLIGDLDSLKSEVLTKIESLGTKIIKYPREKDYTDTQLAVNYAVDMGCNELVMLGSIGSRIDHSLANIMNMVILLDNGIQSCIMNENNIIYITKSSISLSGTPGDLLSLIPIGGDVTGIYTEGLQYSLRDSTIKLGDPLGVSNVFTSDMATVKIKSGYLLIIKSRD